MAISLADVRSVTNNAPLRALFYGDQGNGKTTLASEFPKPIFLQVEEGTPAGVEIASFGFLETYDALMESALALYHEDHDFQTVVVDSASALQKLLFAETCRRGDEHGKSKAKIEDFGYGKGYVNAKNVLQEFLVGMNALRRDKGMNILYTAHALVSRYDDPDTVSYDRYDIDLHKQLYGELTRDLDMIALLKKPVQIKDEKLGQQTRAIGQGGGQTILIHTVGQPSFVAKNRYDMPASIRFERGKGFSALAPFLPGMAEQA